MKSILKAEPYPDPNSKVWNYLRPSETATFYDQFYGSHPKETKPELHKQNKQKHAKDGSAYRIMEEIIAWLEKTLPREAVVIELGGSMHQQRSANAYKRFTNYIPLDIGYSNIKQYTERFDKNGIVADATELPFKDNTIDCIITHTFLEHPIHPEKVLQEIVRVLKPGGIVVHNDAWFCRWWQRYGIVGLKRVKMMSLREKTIWLLSRITEFPPLRLGPVIIKRLLKLRRPTNPITLSYNKLKPNYTLHLGCDEDAASSIDPVDVIRFYESRGFELVKPLSRKERLLHPNKYIMLRKK